MKTRVLHYVRVVLLAGCHAWTTAAAIEPDVFHEDENAILLAQPGRLHITAGLRSTHLKLLSHTQGRPHEGSFIGSIYKLIPEQNYGPTRPYVQGAYRGPWFSLGLGFSLDRLVVATMDDRNRGDGDIHMTAWIFYLLASCPNRTPFTPFVEWGQGYYRNHFNPLPVWSDGGRKRFDLENSKAVHMGGGCDVALTDALSVNLYVRYTDVEVDGEYVIRRSREKYRHKPFTFTLEHIAYGIGMQYAF